MRGPGPRALASCGPAAPIEREVAAALRGMRQGAQFTYSRVTQSLPEFLRPRGGALDNARLYGRSNGAGLAGPTISEEPHCFYLFLHVTLSVIYGAKSNTTNKENRHQNAIAKRQNFPTDTHAPSRPFRSRHERAP